MLGEIPAPTFAEEDRIQFLANRFTEEGLQNISIDEAGNAMGILPGQKGDHTILVVAHADTPFDAASDHAMFVTEKPDYWSGYRRQQFRSCCYGQSPTDSRPP